MMRVLGLCLSAVVLFALPASARKAKDEYVDTKHRFALKLPSGWRLHPRPGDIGGMMFRKDVDGTFAIFAVNVRALRPSETLDESLRSATRPFEAEIGYTPAGDTPASIGLLLGKRRSFTVYASGDKNTVRSIEMHVLHAFGFVHTLHFETLEKHRGRYQRDHDRLVGSYDARAGRKKMGKLIGKWRSETGGPQLVLDESTRFELGPLKGTWDTDGGKLTLHVKGGAERYRYTLDRNRLTLRSSNLDGPAVYVRSGASVYEDRPEKKKRARPVRRDELIGRWKALDTPSTEPLMLQLAPSGSVAFGPMSGSWKYKRSLLTIRSTAGVTYTYHVTLQRGRMLLSGGDLEKELWLERE